MVTLWNLATGSPAHVFERQGGRIFGMAFSPDGSALATGHQDGTIRLWDFAASRQFAAAASTPVHARALMFSNDGKLLLTQQIRLATPGSHREGAVQVWDATDSEKN
jgi:WD40 repeat protein